jgi:hypothetical protein
MQEQTHTCSQAEAPLLPHGRRGGGVRGAGPGQSPSEELVLHSRSFDAEGRASPLFGRGRQAMLQAVQVEQVVLTMPML